MEIETREAALCVFRRSHETADRFLFAEIGGLPNGLLYRPPGGGMEPGETPDGAVRREIEEELGLTLNSIIALGSIDHVWFCNGRNVRERAWIFLADASDYPALANTHNLLEADGQHHPLLWRELVDDHLPPVCPAELPAFLQAKLQR